MSRIQHDSGKLSLKALKYSPWRYLCALFVPRTFLEGHQGYYIGYFENCHDDRCIPSLSLNFTPPPPPPLHSSNKKRSEQKTTHKYLLRATGRATCHDSMFTSLSSQFEQPSKLNYTSVKLSIH